MALAKSSGIYGVKQLQIKQLLTDVAGSAPTYGTAIPIPGIKLLGMDKKITNKESRGDEMLIDTEDTLDSIDISWDNVELPMKACEAIEGAVLGNSGTGSTEINTMLEHANAVGNYFKIDAIAKRGSNGVAGVMVELYKVRGTLTYSFKGEDFAVCSFKGKAIPVRGTIDTYANAIRKTSFGATQFTLS